MSKPDKKMLLILAMVLGITALHYTTTTHSPPLHALYRKLYYFPILLSAIFFRLPGATTISILVTVLYIPHVQWQWGGSFFYNNADKTLEIALYNSIGLVVGWYSNYQHKLKQKLKETICEVQEKTRILLELRDSMQKSERLQALGLLGAGMSHEIKNPLASIRGILELLFDDSLKDQNKEELKNLAWSEIDRINRIVVGFLDMSRQSDEETEVNLREFLDSFHSLMSPQFRKKKISFSLEKEISEDYFCINRGALQQILLNLVLNALDFASQSVRLKVYQQEENLVFDVEDDGEGINEAIREKIFDIFYTTRSSGTGLGLSISCGLARDLRGKIHLISLKNPTVFRLEIGDGRKVNHGKHSLGG